VCAADGAVVEAGGQPEPRRVATGGRTVAFWDAPEQFAHWFAGYFNRGDGCLPVRMLEGFPLGEQFAEPAAGDDVITGEELFGRPYVVREDE
jgi:hypothetical protein